MYAPASITSLRDPFTTAINPFSKHVKTSCVGIIIRVSDKTAMRTEGGGEGGSPSTRLHDLDLCLFLSLSVRSSPTVLERMSQFILNRSSARYLRSVKATTTRALATF